MANANIPPQFLHAFDVMRFRDRRWNKEVGLIANLTILRDLWRQTGVHGPYEPAYGAAWSIVTRVPWEFHGMANRLFNKATTYPGGIPHVNFEAFMRVLIRISNELIYGVVVIPDDEEPAQQPVPQNQGEGQMAQDQGEVQMEEEDPDEEEPDEEIEAEPQYEPVPIEIIDISDDEK